VLWFYLFPNYRTVLLIFFAIPVAVLAVVFSLYFKDTPISLITKNSPEKAYEDLLYIAQFNGIQEPDFTIEEIK
jgi:ABC-type sugar transport system permease subunit